MTFSKLGLSPTIVTIVEKQGYEKPYPVQEEAIPKILKGKDILAIAKTGSGKTDAYILPILEKRQNIKSEKSRNVSVLILVPTRELAVQLGDILREYCAQLSTKVKTMAVYGGVSINPQMKGLYGVDILVATPGRLLDLIDCNALQIAQVETFVLDEADKMLNLGFQEEMERIFFLLPRKRQNLLFSATLTENVEEIKGNLLTDPSIIKFERKENNLDLIDQVGYFVEDDKKGPLLRYIIKTHKAKQVLIFASSIDRVDKIMKKLIKNGVTAKAIHSRKTQGARTSALEQFKAGKLHVLVSTDLLSRGIDIEFLPLVINYELPRSPKDFIHRIGRTGRAENPGQAISLISEDEKQHFRVIQKKMKKWVDMISSDHIDLHGY